MSDILTHYFNDYAESALGHIHIGLSAIHYYSEAIRRLENGIDISDSIPEIKRVGSQIALDTAKELLLEYEQRIKHAWDLPKTLANLATSKITSNKERLENLPRYEISHTFKLDAGKVTVHITTANQNHHLDINYPGNAMIAKAALLELEQYLTLTQLST